MNIQHNETLIEKLAAEYVLGTLKGGARRRFEALLPQHAVLRRAVAEWQDRLHPLAQFSTAADPAPHVWRDIEQKLGLAHTDSRSRRNFWLDLREDLGFWRGLGLVSTTLATILLSVLLARQPDSASASYVAALTDDKAQTMMVVTGDTGRRRLTVKLTVPQQLAADQTFELWALPKSGAPRSLGLVAANQTVTLPLPDNTTPQTIAALAVSLEPKGGSPDPNGPSGPVLFKGAWLQL
jgi:anti-sigma-K factor RskA